MDFTRFSKLLSFYFKTLKNRGRFRTCYFHLKCYNFSMCKGPKIIHISPISLKAKSSQPLLFGL
jgi:hypothetical protein